jgi:hypothetical protein
MAKRSGFSIVNTCKHPKTTKLNLNISKEECNNNLFFSNIEKTKHTRKQQQKKSRQRRELTFKLPFCPLNIIVSSSHICLMGILLIIYVFFFIIFLVL